MAAIVVDPLLRELDAEVAERVMGWQRRAESWYPGPQQMGYWPGSLPPFSASPTAARLVEDEIERRGLGEVYARRLFAVVNGECDITLDEDGGHVTAVDLFAVLRATPEQRCRAALAAIP